MKLFVGLGNPGKKYEKTRHNIGFFVLDALSEKLGLTIDQEKFKGLLCQTKIKNEKVILFKPLTYMNLSGEAVVQVKNYYQIEEEDIIVVYDDMALPTGKLRLREKGSSGGHNGMENIIQHLHTDELKRIRIGIDNNPLIDHKDYVIGKFSRADLKIIKMAAAEAAEALIDSVSLSFVDLMSKYNHK